MFFYQICLLLLWQPFPLAESKLVAALFSPHGDIALDPTFLEPNSKAREAGDEIAKASRAAASWFSTRHELDVIFLSTPHGIQLTHDFGIYLGRQASGSINITGDGSNHKQPYTVSLPPIELAGDLSLDLVVELTKNMNNGNPFNVSGIATSADGAQDVPLEWAEIIPLLLFPNHKSRYNHRYIIWSYPLRRYTESPEMVPELLAVGNALRAWMEAHPLKIGVLISGDMSHTHQASGPYGYSNASAAFDAAVGTWATNPCQHASALLKTARELQSNALSCGFTGMVLLHGMLCGDLELDDDNHSGSSSRKWEPLDNDRVFVNRNATYYGMMAATFDSSSTSTASRMKRQSTEPFSTSEGVAE